MESKLMIIKGALVTINDKNTEVLKAKWFKTYEILRLISTKFKEYCALLLKYIKFFVK